MGWRNNNSSNSNNDFNSNWDNKPNNNNKHYDNNKGNNKNKKQKNRWSAELENNFDGSKDIKHEKDEGDIIDFSKEEGFGGYTIDNENK